MAEVRWTPQAADDLEGITQFIAKHSPRYASLFAINVITAVDRLADFPEPGRIVPERNNPQIREIILGNYRIVYRLRYDAAELLTVHHAARPLDISNLP